MKPSKLLQLIPMESILKLLFSVRLFRIYCTEAPKGDSLEEEWRSSSYLLEVKKAVLITLKGGEIRDTKNFNLSRNIVSLQVFVDVSRFSPCVINLTRNKNICCRLKKYDALIG